MLPTVALFLGIVCCCLAAPHQNVARGTTSLIPTFSSSLPINDPTQVPEVDQRKHSKHVNDFYKLYGWLKPGTSVPDSDLPKAIRRIQRKLKEPVTGTFSEKMTTIMSSPHCGTKQTYNATEAEDHSAPNNRFALMGPKWGKTTLTWRIESYSNDLTTARQQSTISAAFAQWMNLIPLNIVQAAANMKADINIRFTSLGKDNTALGITTMISDGIYMIPGDVNITFNDDFQWSDESLFSVLALHEIGHALGMDHSNVRDAVMFAYYEGFMRPLQPDDKMGIHSAYGWKTPKWSRIDSGSKITNMIQVTSDTATPAANDGLYQMRSTGQILRYSNSAWTSVDNYKETAQITGANGILYQRHYDGGTFRWTGTASNWQSLSNTDTNVIDIVAASDQLYSRRKDGSVARLSGSTWVTIPLPSIPSTRQIAITDDKTLWILLPNGLLVRSTWPHTTDSWIIVDSGTFNIAIAVGGNELYKLQNNGLVVWLDNAGPYWNVIENAGSVGIYAVGKLLYSRHVDGTVWRWTGTSGVWEMIDERGGVSILAGERGGSVWSVTGGSEVWMLVS